MSSRQVEPHGAKRLAGLTVFACLMAGMVAIQPAYSIELKWGNRPETTTVGSIQKRKITYLNLADVERSLPVTVKRDPEAGLFVLCSETTCLPVFAMDPEEYQRSDSTDFASVAQVAEVLGCIGSMSKQRVTFDCPRGNNDLRKVGSAPGDVAPGIRGHAPGDSSISLTDLHRNHKVVIVFVRSLEWDPFSQTLVRQLQSLQDSLRSGNAQTLIIHGYADKQSAAWRDSLKLTMPLIADDASAMMRGYDVFDRGSLPHPSIFVVDQSGIIRLRKVFDDLSVPPDVSAVLEAVARTP